MFLRFPWITATYRSARLSHRDDADAPVDDRQELVEHFSTAALAQAYVLVIGAGGLGSHIVCGLARKGAGMIGVVDYDAVEASNLNRQTFTADDIGQPKALALAKRAAVRGSLGSSCIGHDVCFKDETAERLLDGATLCVCAVDNNATRRLASLYCRYVDIPCIHLAVNENADCGWIFVEEPSCDLGCLGCVFPRIAGAAGQRVRCATTPAVLDILLVVGGMALYAVDSLLMGRERGWNYRDVHLLCGAAESVVASRAGCSLCGNHEVKP